MPFIPQSHVSVEHRQALELVDSLIQMSSDEIAELRQISGHDSKVLAIATRHLEQLKSTRRSLTAAASLNSELERLTARR